MSLHGIKTKTAEILTSPETLANSSKVALVSGFLTVATGIENIKEHGSLKKETGLAAVACLGSLVIGTAAALSK